MSTTLRLTTKRGARLRTAWIPVVLACLAGCSVTHPATVGAARNTSLPTAASATAGGAPSVSPSSATPSASVAPSASGAPSASATPSTSTAPTRPTTAAPSPSAPATSATSTPDPADGLTSAQRSSLGSCLTATVRPGSSGTCTRLALRLLTTAGLYSGSTTGSVNVAAANAILNYQRSRGIEATASVQTKTWVALASNAPALPTVLPAQCRTSGIVLCVDKAHRILSYVDNGSVVKEIKVRVGGWNKLPNTTNWRVFETASGTWRVFKKMVDPPSATYGSGAMPYSVMFDPNMYVHYSSDFAETGYTRSSHGCVNVASLADAKWFYANTPVGAKVYVF